MPPRRDLFTDFERMRREMDEFLGAFWERPMVGPRRARGFTPKVDLYYCGEESPKAVVKADLAGVPLSDVHLEVSGRELVISGERPVQETEGRVYQQVEVETGPFRRVIELVSREPDDLGAGRRRWRQYEQDGLTVRHHPQGGVA